MKLKERFELTKRGYSILGKYCPCLIKTKVLAAFSEAIAPFITIWFSAQIINEIAGEARRNTLILYVVLTVLFGIVFSTIKNICTKIVNEKEASMWEYFAKIFADKQMSMDYVDLENVDVQLQKQKTEDNLFVFGNGLAQLIWDTPELVKVIVGIVASLSLTITLFASSAGNTFIDSPLWVIGVLGVIIISGIINGIYLKKENKVFEKWSEGMVWYDRVFMFYGKELSFNPKRAKDVRIYGQEKIADREMNKLKEYNEQNGSAISKMSMYQSIPKFISGLCNVACYLFVVTKAYYGAFGVGSIVQYVGALVILVQSFGDLSFSITENQVYCEHLKNLFEFLDRPNDMYQGTLPIEKRFFCEDGDNDYAIEFKNVSFKYPGSDTYVLKNINTTLSIGKKQAIVGANGSGKSTFIKLLCRLYDPTEGEILLNGINIKKFDYDEYMQLFSMVFQDFKLFAFSLGQNVAANMKYDEERVIDCMKKSGIYERYQTMSEGLDTCLYKNFSEKGVEISGGEEQKIALARALYKNTPMLVLDEPTAALDPIAEAEVYSRFSDMVGNKTAIYISHRLSSCQFCDEITVFDNGSIVQKGSHKKLSKEKDGKYYELWNAQAKYYQMQAGGRENL